MAENVKVIVRCRPMNKKEHDLNCKAVVKMRNCVVETWNPTDGPAFPKEFTFDSTYDQDSHTETIYNDICYPLVESVLEGYNATIFVYGQTGCGKSFTMDGGGGGGGDGLKSRQSKGVISRAFEHIFEAIAVTSGVKYLALISYLEIYNEQIRDLLLPNNNNNNNNEKLSSTTSNNNLNLKESPLDGVTVPGLTLHPVHDANECEHFLNIGSKNRIIGATLMNQNSSRSHSIFTISIEQISNNNDNNSNNNNNETIRKGKLNLVDLAGSERQTKTGATGDRLKEATKINLSLSALGNVISALVDGKAKHIPYRDSKLTRLLQDSLGGNTRTLMIACISPSNRDYVETLSTLRYANRAKNIHNKPHVNEDPKDAILRKYQEEIERLKNLLDNQNVISQITTTIESNINNNDNLNLKRDQLIENYQNEMEKLRSLHENEKHEKETVLKQIDTIRDQYELNIAKLNSEINERKKFNDDEILDNKDEIMSRIEILKAAMIGGEKSNDRELSERRKKKKMAAEHRASVIAHLLAKIDMNEDRETLQNQYKDISEELHLKSDALRKYRHKVKLLEKEINDLQSEFELERQDYLETIRKQERNTKLLQQISEKLISSSTTLHNRHNQSNYSDLETIKQQSYWLEDSQKYQLPELIVPRTKLPPTAPAGRILDTQTAPARLLQSYSDDDNKSFNNDDDDKISSNDSLMKKKLDKSETDDFIGSYFQPTMKRANELLTQSARFDTGRIFNTWRDYTKRNKMKSNDTDTADNVILSSPIRNNLNFNNNGSNSLNGSWNNLWLNGSSSSSSIMTDSMMRKPLRLEALPDINSKTRHRNGTRFSNNMLEFL